MADLGLEIYHLDVFGGDSTAILVKDLEQEVNTGGKTIHSLLIDAGAEGGGGAYLRSYLKAHNMQLFDCIVATHYHQDHIQGFLEAGIEFKSFIDMGGYKLNKGGQRNPRNGVGKGANTGVFEAYKSQVQLQETGKGAARIEIPFIAKDFELGKAAPVICQLGDSTGVTLTCYCANGILANGTDVLGAQKTKDKQDISPNDVSLAFVLQWGDFRYLTAGDLSGDRDLKSYYNIEEHLVKYLKSGPLQPENKITVLKASHHGSEHSNHKDLLKELSPETVVISCNLKKQVPSHVFLKRLGEYLSTKRGANVVFTNTMKVFKNDDRYEQLLGIKDSIANGNVAFSGEGDEERIASNLGIKCAIIRRRMRDGTYQRYPNVTMPSTSIATEGITTTTTMPTITEMNGYEIVLMPRPANESKDIEKSVKFRSYQIKKGWLDKDLKERQIFNGFREQAKAMTGWIRKDGAEGRAVGIDYMDTHYPGLARIAESSSQDKLEGALYNEMCRMFGESFFLDGTVWKVKSAQGLTSDQKRTFYALLINNSYQKAFNQVNRYGQFDKSYYDPTGAWNSLEAPEPYTTEGTGSKRSNRDLIENRS